MTTSRAARERRVLGIDVPDALIERWFDFLAPAKQPFLVPAATAHDRRSLRSDDLSFEHWDTYRGWAIDKGLDVVWLDEKAFTCLGQPERAVLVRGQVRAHRGAVPTVRSWQDVLPAPELKDQADGHRFVWWPSLMRHAPRHILRRSVAHDRLPSRHDEVTARTWRAAAAVLPNAREIAGTFPRGSGPNCFGTVMAAAGIPAAADSWVVHAPFEEWLRSATAPGGEDAVPGTVLIWRDGDGVASHALVTLGDGWALEKPSQEWHSPRAVVDVREAIKRMRTPGLRLHRRRVV